MTETPLTRQDLDSMQCEDPNCTHDDDGDLFIHAACHPRSPLWCDYLAGTLVFRCAECYQLVTRIAVAAREWQDR